MKKITFSLTVLLISAVFFITANAQNRELRGTGQGRGFLIYEGQRDRNLTEANIFLKRTGDIEIRLFGDQTYTFTGRWYNGRNDAYEFEVTGGFDSSGAVGKGTANIKANGQIVRLELKGYSKRQQFSVTFDGYDTNNATSPYGNYSKSSPFVGVYRSSERTQKYNQDFTIIRVLRIKDDGTAELASRFKGADPTVNRENLRLHGDLLPEIRDRKTVLHTGTWRNSGRGIEVLLKTINDNDRVEASWRFEFRVNDRDNLQTITWDKTVYGSGLFKFVRVINEDNDDPYQKPTDNFPRPSRDRINLSEDGQGDLSIGRDPRKTINRVTVNAAADNTVEIGLRIAGGSFVRFTGQIVNNDGRVLDVRLTGSGNADASGNLTIEQSNANRITRLYGNGRLDNRNFTVDFNGGNASVSDRDSTDRNDLNLFQNGSGLWTRERWPNASIESVAVVGRVNNDVDVSLRLANGERITFRGKIESRNNYGLVIRLTNSSEATASGTINIEYASNKTINRLYGEGRIDGNKFSINFTQR